MITNYVPFNETNLLKEIDFDTTNLFITSLQLANRLYNEDVKMPINSKEIAIKNILNFLRYFQSNMNEDRTMNIPVHKTKTNKYHNLEWYFSRRRYRQYMDLLNQLDILMPVLNENNIKYCFKDGKFNNEESLSKKYYLSEDLEKDLVILYFDNYNKFSSRIKLKLKGLDDKFVKTVKRIKIDVKSAYNQELADYNNGIISTSKFINRINRLFKFSDEERYIKYGEKVRRIFHNITNLSKTQRKFTNIRFNSIDIPNCHPTLLIYVLRSNNLPLDENYIKDCIDCKFYEQFYNKTYKITEKKRYKGKDKGTWKWYLNIITENLTNTKEDRDIIKKQLCKSVFFKFDTSADFNKEFKRMYPVTWESYKTYLNNNSETSAQVLQNCEADIINNIIPQNSSHYYPHFDCLYFDDSNDKNQIVDELKQKFIDVGVELKVIEYNGVKEDI